MVPKRIVSTVVSFLLRFEKVEFEEDSSEGSEYNVWL